MRPRKPRKPETILRYARQSVNTAREWNNLERGTGNHWSEVNQTLVRTLGLLSQLRKALAARSATPGAPRR